MSYYFNKTLQTGFEDAVTKVTEALKTEGFGVLTEIDIQATLKKKLNVDFRKYKILGVCNPTFAYKALVVEDKIGLMLPCNVVVQETSKGHVEISAINPVESMMAIENVNLNYIADEVQMKLKKVIASL